jgi:hypothetical protein
MKIDLSFIKSKSKTSVIKLKFPLYDKNIANKCSCECRYCEVLGRYGLCSTMEVFGASHGTPGGETLHYPCQFG